MGQWIGPVVAALIAASASLSFAWEGADARLLRRAGHALDLAGKVQIRATRAALHEAAERDISRALTLRASAGAVAALVICAISTTAIAVTIPWYVTSGHAGEGAWVANVWLVLWVVYLGLTIALWAGLARVISKRNKAVSRPS